MGARSYLAENSVDIPAPEKIPTFFRSVRRSFYVEVTGKMIDKFPFSDSTLKTLGFLNPDLLHDVPATSVVELGQKFGVSPDQDDLQEEYRDYQLTPNCELLKFDVKKTPPGLLVCHGQLESQDLASLECCLSCSISCKQQCTFQHDEENSD